MLTISLNRNGAHRPCPQYAEGPRDLAFLAEEEYTRRPRCCSCDNILRSASAGRRGVTAKSIAQSFVTFGIVLEQVMRTSIWLTVGNSYPASRISSRCLIPLTGSESISHQLVPLNRSMRRTSLILQHSGSSLPADNPGEPCRFRAAAWSQHRGRVSEKGLCTLCTSMSP